jgi:hypothetical protein
MLNRANAVPGYLFRVYPERAPGFIWTLPPKLSSARDRTLSRPIGGMEPKLRADVGKLPTGGNYGSRSFALADRHTYPDYPSHLGFRRAPLNDRAHPIHCAQARGQWVVKSKDLERVFSVQREAVDAAIRFANESGKEGKPGVVLFQKSKTKFEKIWTYGQNPYPPARSDLPMSRPPEPEILAGSLD